MFKHDLSRIPRDKLVMVGKCSKCRKTVTRPYPCEVAVCDCANPPMPIPLEPHVKIILRMRNGRKLREIISRSKIPLVVMPKRKKEPKFITLGSSPTYCPRCDSIEIAGNGISGYRCIECEFKWKTVAEYIKEWNKHHPEEEQPEECADSDEKT